MNLVGTFQPRLPIIGCNPFCYYLMVLNWHCRHDREFKKTYINFIPCSARTISSFCQTIIFFGAIWYVCDGEHFVLKIHKLWLFDLVFKNYPSCSHPHSKCCRSISCCPSKHHLVMAPKASSTCMPKKHKAASSSFVPDFVRSLSLIVKNSEILDFPISKLIKSVELITRIYL